MTKKFGWGKQPKNRRSKKGIQTSKEFRKFRRKQVARIKHCLLFCIPLSDEDFKFYLRYGRYYIDIKSREKYNEQLVKDYLMVD